MLKLLILNLIAKKKQARRADILLTKREVLRGKLLCHFKVHSQTHLTSKRDAELRGRKPMEHAE